MPIFAGRRIELKIVYYGPALCGKTTNLQQLHEGMTAEGRGRLMSMSNLKDDRTIFFDLLPIQVPLGGGYTLSAKLYTVPGQIAYSQTRKLVLQNVDGVVFVADSRRDAAQANAESFQDLHRNLKALNIDPASVPVVVQFNKRDLPDVKPLEELAAAWKARGVPVCGASAMTGEGVFETLELMLRRMYADLVAKLPMIRRHGVGEEAFLDGVRRNFAGSASGGGKP